MIQLPFDPAGQDDFWQALRKLPSFPKNDHIPLKRMLFEAGAIFKLPGLLRELDAGQDPLLVVMDATPMRRGNDELKSHLIGLLKQEGWEIEPLLLLPDATGQVHTDMARIRGVQHRLRPGMAVVSIGSGVVTDITKHACFLFQQTSGLPLTYIVVQTANSVSAFTSNMAPVFVDGVKRTLPSRYPDALVCDLETLRDAPLEMTLAGAGDMLAAFVSLPDYYLAHSLGMEENWSDLPEALLGDLYGLLFENAAAIRERTLEGMSLLAKLIALGGLAMSLSHATTPMSGYEHVVSHVLDLMNEIDGKPLAMHGSQVALAGVLCAAAYQEFLDGYDPGNPAQAFTVPAPEEMRKNIRSEFNAIDSSGAAAEKCWHDYSLKLTHWAAIEPSLGGFKSRWNETKAALRRLTRTSEEIRALLEKLGAPPQFSRLSPAVSEAQARKAFLAAPLMRKRLTLGDLFIFQNWDRASLWERIWKSAGQDS